MMASTCKSLFHNTFMIAATAVPIRCDATAHLCGELCMLLGKKGCLQRCTQVCKLSNRQSSRFRPTNTSLHSRSIMGLNTCAQPETMHVAR